MKGRKILEHLFKISLCIFLAFSSAANLPVKNIIAVKEQSDLSRNQAINIQGTPLRYSSSVAITVAISCSDLLSIVAELYSEKKISSTIYFGLKDMFTNAKVAEESGDIITRDACLKIANSFIKKYEYARHDFKEFGGNNT